MNKQCENCRGEMYNMNYEEIQQVDENYVHSRNKALNSMKDFASLK